MSEDVLVCGCWDESPEYHWSEWKKARKVHKCAECLKDIQPGELYCRNTSIWDTRFIHDVNCEKCQDLTDSMLAMGWCIFVGYLHDAHQQYLEEYRPPKLKENIQNV